VKSPRNRRVMDLPRPHPGQKVMPAFCKGHKEKWYAPGDERASSSRPVSQQAASIGKLRRNLPTFSPVAWIICGIYLK